MLIEGGSRSGRRMGAEQFLVVKRIPIDLFWSARYHRDPANQWLRTLMIDTFNFEEAARSNALRDRERSSDVRVFQM